MNLRGERGRFNLRGVIKSTNNFGAYGSRVFFVKRPVVGVGEGREPLAHFSYGRFAVKKILVDEKTAKRPQLFAPLTIRAERVNLIKTVNQIVGGIEH